MAKSSIKGSYEVTIVGGVAHKIPINKESSSYPSGLLRKKNLYRKMRSYTNRRVSCKDLGGGDCEGWLWKKNTHAGSLTSSKWVKRWFVLKNQNLYYYKDPETSERAQGLIHLPGFQVSPAPELKSRKFVFKAHHSGTTFYFASNRQDDMAKWMNKLGLAAITYEMKDSVQIKQEVHKQPDIPEHTAYYSESDEEGESSSNTPIASSLESSREDLTESKDDLVNAYANIGREKGHIDGRDATQRRRSMLQRKEKLAQLDNVEDLEYGKKLASLQRTLKAKEQELNEIDYLFHQSSITSDKLQAIASKLHLDTSGHSTSATSEEDDQETNSPVT